MFYCQITPCTRDGMNKISLAGCDSLFEYLKHDKNNNKKNELKSQYEVWDYFKVFWSIFYVWSTIVNMFINFRFCVVKDDAELSTLVKTLSFLRPKLLRLIKVLVFVNSFNLSVTQSDFFYYKYAPVIHLEFECNRNFHA